VLRDRLRLGFTAEAAFQVLNASFELTDRGLESSDHVICDGSHCEGVVWKVKRSDNSSERASRGRSGQEVGVEERDGEMEEGRRKLGCWGEENQTESGGLHPLLRGLFGQPPPPI
jgi:hypothetical protein